MTRSHTAAICALCLAGALTVLSLPLVREAAGARAAIHASQIPAVQVLALALLSGIALASVLNHWLRRSGVSEMTLIAAATLAGACLALLFALEAFSTMLPTGVLPTTIRRATFTARGASGLWLLLIISVALVIATVPQLSAKATRLLRQSLQRDPLEVAAAITAIAVVLGAVHYRYVGWVTASAATESVHIEAWATPWIGPLSLVAVWCLGAGAIAVVMGRRATAAILGGLGGWLLILCSGLVIVAGEEFAQLRIESIAPPAVRDYSPQFHVAGAAWIAYGLGWLGAAAGAAMLVERSESNRKSPG